MSRKAKGIWNDNWSRNTVRGEIMEYCKMHGISEADFRFLGIYEWQNVYDQVLTHFVKPDYAKRNGLYWANINNGFQYPPEYIFVTGRDGYAGYEWLERLPEMVACGKVYLLLEDDSAKYWIAECSTVILHLIINDTEAGNGDYFIVDKKYDWLITENHHAIVQFIGTGLHVEKIMEICEPGKQ